MRAPRGFTLLEILTALALATLVYALVSSATLHLSRTARAANRAAEGRARVVRISEQLRWQLRGLFTPAQEDSADPTAAKASTGVQTEARSGPRRVRTLGALALLGRRTQEPDQEILLFRSNRLERGNGAAEVGYRILVDSETGRPALAYRQYPWADPAGLRPPEEDPEAPWRVVCREVVGLRLEFSADGQTWQREWERLERPRRIRFTLVLDSGTLLQAEVVPGVEAGRW